MSVSDVNKTQALRFIELWLTDIQFSDYVPQIEHLVASSQWDYLLDSFYQVIPFGTGGRRGEVGIGPNRINSWTIRASAQGHSQYILKKFGDTARERGVVLAFDVRQFFYNVYLSEQISNPVKNITSKDLAYVAAQVYAGNNIKVFLFDDVRTTPELSFAIRRLGAVGGDMFSASHNPPDHNGKKVYDELGGQLIPPQDEALVKEVTEEVTNINNMEFDDASKRGLITFIGEEIDSAFIDAASSLSLSKNRSVRISFTPLHGCGTTSVVKVLEKSGFQVFVDPKTQNPSGLFENITFHIPNPEVVQSFDTSLKFAQEMSADILLSSDPDADRLGIMVKHKNSWQFLTGNEIATILSQYVIEKRKSKIKGTAVIIKTAVTSGLIQKICDKNGVKIIGDLLVGFKYIAQKMNEIESRGEIDNFLFGCEESHGYIAGNYVRDKDASVAALWLSELSAELKEKKYTLIDYIEDIYARYGYFENYLTEIRMLGAEGKAKIEKIQKFLREKNPTSFGKFVIQKRKDYQEDKPIVSDSDFYSKDMLEFHLAPSGHATSIKVTIRPSGTEPKTKIYFEIGSEPCEREKLNEVKNSIHTLLQSLEREVMKECYKIIGVDFPDRGFLIFWQLPLEKKLQYFEIEPDIVELKNEKNKALRIEKLNKLLSFLGADPMAKVDKAFQAKYHTSIASYLAL